MAKNDNEHFVLSLVMPVYKQAKTIENNFLNIQNTLNNINVPYEIIMVIDGDFDRTYETIKKYKSKNVKIFQLKENLGKGYAVKYGMLRANGDIVGFLDSGMDLDPTGISMLINHMEWYNADIIIGSKLHPVSQVSYPNSRKVLSWGYRTITRILFGFKVRDTQVGIKFFRKEVAHNVFSRIATTGFAFDVEMLAIAYALGYTRIFEAPVKLNFTGASSITSTTLLKTISTMLLDTFFIFYRMKILKSYRKKDKSIIPTSE